jgi:hypothetical protein
VRRHHARERFVELRAWASAEFPRCSLLERWAAKCLRTKAARRRATFRRTGDRKVYDERLFKPRDCAVCAAVPAHHNLPGRNGRGAGRCVP